MERVRFGIYDFSPSTGELRKNGVAVRLQTQPARVLATLVAGAGAIVSRETLQREVWTDGTHVDFERGLNFCVAQVRAALGDSAEAPRYIETVPKQGYRFIAPVTRTDGPMPPPTPAQAGLPDAARPSPAGSATPGHRSLLTAALALIVLVAAAVAWNRAAPEPPTVVVVPFYNDTGRAELDPLARSVGDAAVARLAAPERTAWLSVIGNAPTLQSPFARGDVQRVASELDAQFVVIGQLKADGSGLRVIAHLIRADDMKHLWAQTYDDSAFALPAQTRTAEQISEAISTALASAR